MFIGRYILAFLIAFMFAAGGATAATSNHRAKKTEKVSKGKTSTAKTSTAKSSTAKSSTAKSSTAKSSTAKSSTAKAKHRAKKK